MRPTWLMALVFLAAASAQGAMRAPVCAQQETINGWSHPHKVDSLTLRGLELNQAKKSLLFVPSSLYVVLLWDKSRTTAIELDAPVISPAGQEGRDERGMRWRVWKGRTCN